MNKNENYMKEIFECGYCGKTITSEYSDIKRCPKCLSTKLFILNRKVKNNEKRN